MKIRAPLQGTIMSVSVQAGESVAAGQELLLIEAMKMQHPLCAPRAGRVAALITAPGRMVDKGQPLLELQPQADGADAQASEAAAFTPSAPETGPRPDLAEVEARRAATSDAARPEAVARRHAQGRRTARENLSDLCDADSFVEYGALALAAQRSRRTPQELIRQTPADGLITGTARINGALFGERAGRCAVLAYDYTVLAGTQGFQNHRKTDRMLQLAGEQGLPVVFFTEGGGGRPGDTDLDDVVVSGLECSSFTALAALSGRVPLIGINTGRCFAGNAAFLGCCDVIIATAGSNLGMGGPAMIEGGGLGVVAPEEIGPVEVQQANGVIDILVEDDAAAVAAARRYLGYFQGVLADWDCAPQELLRGLVPENRQRAYDQRALIRRLADTDSVLELRAAFAPGMITALIRIEGRPLGLIANDPAHLAGAIDSAAADKAARFMQLCDAHGLPILSLCDTPGIMVGPEAETSGTVRHAARLFVIAASLSVPFACVVLRKAYGLGAQAMAGGHFKAPRCIVSWPSGEFGPMGLEGAVRLGFRRELAAIDDPAERERQFARMVEQLYQRGKALNVASHFEIDDVIDPAQTRRWISAALEGGSSGPRGRPCIDPW